MNQKETKTKIIATIGPASASKEVLKQMMLEGMDVCRLNFSHGAHNNHLEVINIIKELRTELGISVAIMVDLQGPKLRVGVMEGGSAILSDGKELLISTNECIGTDRCVYLTYPDFPKDVKMGDSIYIDDGKIKLKVLKTNGVDEVVTKVIHGGTLSSKKGVNLPDTGLSIPSLTPKDIADVEFALEHDIDWIALSFVRSVTDIVELKDIVKKKKKHALVVAKIEKPEAINELDNIIDLADAIMVARGDLGVELPFEEIPLLQKTIVQKCINAYKPVIIATQMLESMISNFRPTRAEANDVSCAVLDGADALMVSGESSVGKYPVDVIKTMHNIIGYVEKTAYNYYLDHRPKGFDRTFLADSVCYTACKMSEQSDAHAIVIFTSSGHTAYKIAGYRPKADIFVFTDNQEVLPRLKLLWGVRSFYYTGFPDVTRAIEYSIGILQEGKLLNSNDLVIHVGSSPLQQKGRANMLKISYV